MARWDIYNIIGDATPLIGYEIESRDWTWEDQVNPTSDVGLAFHTIVRSLSKTEQQWTDELFELLGRNGGGRILKYEGSTIDGSVTCHDVRINQNGEAEQTEQWAGRIIDIYRVDENTIYDPAKHNWDNVDTELTIEGVPYSIRDVDGGRDPDPRFHLPLLKVVDEDTGFQTLYRGHWGNGWRIAGELPDCVYTLKTIPEHVER